MADLYVVVGDFKLRISETTDIVDVDPLTAHVEERVSLIERILRMRRQFDPPTTITQGIRQAPPFAGFEARLKQLTGKRPWPIKRVPIQHAAHVDEKTLTHLDDMLKEIYTHLKAERDES